MRTVFLALVVCLLPSSCRQPSIVIAHSKVSQLSIAEIDPKEGTSLKGSMTLRATVDYSLDDDTDRNNGEDVAGYRIALYFSGEGSHEYVTFGEPYRLEALEGRGNLEVAFPLKGALKGTDIRRPPVCFFALEKVLFDSEQDPAYKIVARSEDFDYQ